MSFNPRFAVSADPAGKPIPVEATLEEVITEILGRLKDGQIVTQPIQATAGGRFIGNQICTIKPPKNDEVLFTAQIYTDMKEQTAQADHNFIAHALIDIILHEFMEFAKERDAKKEPAPADGKVLEFTAGEGGPGS